MSFEGWMWLGIVFSTFGITIVGEILPQGYFSRNAMAIGSALVPFIRFYQKLLCPVAKPPALILDAWLGTEEVSYFRERELREIIRQHLVAENAELKKREGLDARGVSPARPPPIETFRAVRPCPFKGAWRTWNYRRATR